MVRIKTSGLTNLDELTLGTICTEFKGVFEVEEC